MRWIPDPRLVPPIYRGGGLQRDGIGTIHGEVTAALAKKLPRCAADRSVNRRPPVDTVMVNGARQANRRKQPLVPDPLGAGRKVGDSLVEGPIKNFWLPRLARRIRWKVEVQVR